MIRNDICKVAGALALMLSIPGTASACEGVDCPAPAKVKPLDIMQFMREQAASTRVGQPPRHHSAKAASAKPKQKTTHPTAALEPVPVTAQAPASLASDAAASFASRSYASQEPPKQLPVPVLAREEFNAIDSAAPVPSTETTGASTANDPNVQVVAAAEFNDIDRKADESKPSPFPTIEMPGAAELAKPKAASSPTAVAWLQWLWSTVTGTLTALAAAVRQLIHV
jgi:hypothetical protein